ncbi:conserved domain protein [Clostridium botulinum A3 str. Loch Maree]|nr:conserved domain protein [Clostridium botulinum A3 str. Loch Maree]
MKQVGWVSDLGKYGQELHIEFDKNTRIISLIILKNIIMK